MISKVSKRNKLKIQNSNFFMMFNVNIGALLLLDNVITNLKILRFSQQNVRKMFGFWCITQKMIEISKNNANKIPFPSTFQIV